MMEGYGTLTAVELADVLIERAYHLRASDIHIEPQRSMYRIRMRVDGVLQTFNEIPVELAQQLVARIKVLARLDLAQSMIPQDGKIQCALGEDTFDVRVSVFPATNGSTVVLRLLVNQHDELRFESLGLDITIQEHIDQLLKKSQGFLLVTGPTGSGKTTTLYSALSLLNTDERSIVTLEDPVEYSIAGITQGHINEMTGFTFARGIRSLLRQDPDVIMIGEIRDQESAHIALEASMTGHLVLSTLHTNDGCSTILRLLDMGIEPYLLNSALTGVLAQRLLRRLCSQCRRPFQIDLRSLGLSVEAGDSETITVYEPVGCNSCNNFGYVGRIGIFEYVDFTEDMRALITQNPSISHLIEMARAQGTVFLLQDAFDKLLTGTISLSEFAKLC